MPVFDFLLEQLSSFLSFFWSVFSFWALWQLCDFGLSRLKVKLRKPWLVEQKKDGCPCQDEGQS